METRIDETVVHMALPILVQNLNLGDIRQTVSREVVVRLFQFWSNRARSLRCAAKAVRFEQMAPTCEQLWCDGHSKRLAQLCGYRAIDDNILIDR